MTTTGYLPEPLDLLASACVMSIDGATFPVVDIDLLHATQHQLQIHTQKQTHTHIQHVYTDTHALRFCLTGLRYWSYRMPGWTKSITLD